MNKSVYVVLVINALVICIFSGCPPMDSWILLKPNKSASSPLGTLSGDTLIVDISGQLFKIDAFGWAGASPFSSGDARYVGKIIFEICFSPTTSYVLETSNIRLTDSLDHRFKPYQVFLNQNRETAQTIHFEALRDNRLTIFFGTHDDVYFPVRLDLGQLQDSSSQAIFKLDSLMFNRSSK
jgi:hypothetical protein